MRLTHIHNPLKRRQWEEFIETAHGKLRAENIDLRFNTVKFDGSAARASTVLPAVYFTFGRDWGRKWVELELRPRTVDGERRPQKELYSFLKANLRGRIPVFQHRLAWDGETAASMACGAGDGMRIKVYLDQSDEHQLIDAMVVLARRILPFLNQFQIAWH